ncbi:YbaB/EbfC family nucleoid-associated protein [Streptomyces sp. NBC_01320]|uniref:YbaB/EbfC family nucleoid-associated protein n=1 Tax=Streptomyces sp. NBC_01320 TaxID=2903824 RepID=UPI002E115439|nr:YbaB/EbfC family nucleoid-associated protein [Streptomyces sp. NBC_01320]
MEQRLADAMARIKATEEAVSKADSELRQATVTTRSTDRSVQVTVGSQGALIGLEFLDGKYKNMAAAQLSSAVLQTVEKARAEMARRVVDTFEPLTKAIGDGSFSDHVGVDWENVFGSLLDGAEQGEKPSSATDRLRDEIHEDEAEALPAPAGKRNAARKAKGTRQHGQ